MGYAADMGKDGFSRFRISVLSGLVEGVEVVLHTFDDEDATSLVKVGELPLVVGLLRTVQCEHNLVGKGLPTHKLSQEVDFAKAEVETFGEEVDGMVDGCQATVRQGGCKDGIFVLRHGEVDVVVELGYVEVYVAWGVHGP